MKLPASDDPHGDREGSLPRARVLDILYRHGISVTHDVDDDVMLSKGTLIEVQSLPDPVGGLLVRRQSRVFGIALPEFYVDAPHYH